MLTLPRLKLRALPCYNIGAPKPGELLQEALGGDPWKIAVASMLLCRTKRQQAEPVLFALLHVYPEPGSLADAFVDVVEKLVQPCGFYRQRAKQLIRFSGQYIGDAWNDLRELSGVGPYVADAVGFVCFGCADFESTDGALHARAAARQAEVYNSEAEDQRADSTLLGGAVS